jgi:hypothetical protein
MIFLICDCQPKPQMGSAQSVELKLEVVEWARKKLEEAERDLQDCLRNGDVMTIRDFARRERVSVRIVWYRIHKRELETIKMMVKSRKRTLVIVRGAKTQGGTNGKR